MNNPARMRMKDHRAVIHNRIMVTRNAILGRNLLRSVRAITKFTANG